MPKVSAARRADADDGQEAAGESRFLAIAEEQIAAAGGAEIAGEDVLLAEAGFEKLPAIGFAEVQEDAFGRWLMTGRLHVEPLKRVRLVTGAEFIKPFRCVGKLRVEGASDFGTDFIATAADGRAKSGEQVRGLCAEFHLHATDGFCDDALKSAAPSGMNGGDGAGRGIDQKNGNAVGSLHAEEEARLAGGRSVTCPGRQAATRIGGRSVEDVDNVGMKLLECDKSKIGCAQSGLEAAAIFQDVFAGVPVGEAEV